jgi:hypothetical protein
MSQPEDAAAQALRLAALALQQISARSSSDEDDTTGIEAPDPAPPAQLMSPAADAVSPVALSASGNLSSKLLSSVAQVPFPRHVSESYAACDVRDGVCQGASAVANGAVAIGASTLSGAAAIGQHTLNGA